ncbi:type 1 glutamine amidotransferase [Chitinophaga sedimenti]|uniref:type 1 glutamine amidotransferase n=1 Tax=Chitinophaga sedimenti TaxID=2033606 RepID=UPI002004F3F5|nr:type 1 glutamine amidotransferase [Chitinophaga sedimenti]MCK7557005.1 type 1 glutamine amidotransferase [Chitinophaga sedimenti]
MNIHYFQHVPFEGLGCIADWIDRKGHQVSVTRWYAGDAPPPHDQTDWLIIMGGPMGVYDAAQYPWLETEKAYIREAIQQGKRVLGICLGAQLIAAALGAKVYPNREKEIGWFPVHFEKATALVDFFACYRNRFSLARRHLRLTRKRRPIRFNPGLPEPGLCLWRANRGTSISL